MATGIAEIDTKLETSVTDAYLDEFIYDWYMIFSAISIKTTWKSSYPI